MVLGRIVDGDAGRDLVEGSTKVKILRLGIGLKSKDEMLYAVIQPAGPDAGDGADIFLPAFLRQDSCWTD